MASEKHPADTSLSQHFAVNLAQLLANKFLAVDPDFPASGYRHAIEQQVSGLGYSQRIELHAQCLRQLLPASYPQALAQLLAILGPENPKQTGMFKEFYWLLPVAKFVELYGLEHLDLSLAALAEITKRCTSEYAIRPYLRRYPEATMAQMRQWAQDENFHLRRLASEGCRPKLPWATKLELFISDPEPVFAILELLKADPIKFVQRSVANNLADYLKVNPDAAQARLKLWQSSADPSTQWIIKHGTRRLVKPLVV